MKTILGLAGSNSNDSINKLLVQAVAKKMGFSNFHIVNIEVIDIPVYSNKIESQIGIPGAISQLQATINRADAFVIACPEHNGLMPAFFKILLTGYPGSTSKYFKINLCC